MHNSRWFYFQCKSQIIKNYFHEDALIFSLIRGSVLLTKLYSDDQIKHNELGRACSTYGKTKYMLGGGGLVGKPEQKRPLGRRRHRSENDIKMNLQEGSWRARTELIWPRVGTCGGLLCIR
jgi:hypothetical protein